MMEMIGGLFGLGMKIAGSITAGQQQKEMYDILNSSIVEGDAYTRAGLSNIMALSDATRNSNVNILNSLSGQALSLLMPYMPTYQAYAQQNPQLLSGYSATSPGTFAPTSTNITSSQAASGVSNFNTTSGGINLGYRYDSPGALGESNVPNPEMPSAESNPANNTGLYSRQGPQPPASPDFGAMQTSLEEQYQQKYGTMINAKTVTDATKSFLESAHARMVDQPIKEAQAQYQGSVDKFYADQKQATVDARNEQIAQLQVNTAPNVAPVNASAISAPLNAPNQGALVDWQQMKGMLDQATNYQIQLGNEAVQNSASAKGMLNSGNTMAALQERAQGTANSLVFPYYQQGITNYNQNVLAQNQINSTYQSNLNNALAGIYNQNTSAAIASQLGQVSSGTQKGIAEQQMAQTAAGLLSGLGTSVAGQNTANLDVQANATLANSKRYQDTLNALAKLQTQGAGGMGGGQ